MKSFKKKVQAMKASQIVQAMVDGLNKEWVKVRMHTFIEVERGICYGCAATNAVCQIINRKPTVEDGRELDKIFYNNSCSFQPEQYFLYRFEHAIDRLRKGDIDEYNSFAAEIEVAQIPIKYGKGLPPLWDNDEWKEKLFAYQKLAIELKEQGL